MTLPKFENYIKYICFGVNSYVRKDTLHNGLEGCHKSNGVIIIFRYFEGSYEKSRQYFLIFGSF